jgi:hypothetical protein
VTGFTKKQKAEILERDDGVCLMWGSNPFCAYYADTVNHRINRGSGGSKGLNATVNGCAICSSCNQMIEHDASLAAVARVRGVKVRSSHNIERDLETLAATPLVHPISGTYRVTEDGDRYSLEIL